VAAGQFDLPSLTNAPSSGSSNRPPGDRAPGEPAELGLRAGLRGELDKICLQL
jgi:hypothetical protein